jgi:cytochrome b561
MLTTVVIQLSKYPALNNLEKQAGVPKAYAVIGVGALYFFLIIFNLGGQLLTNFAGFVIPSYYSLGALFTHNKEDDTQWLTVRGLLSLTAGADPEIRRVLRGSRVANYLSSIGLFSLSLPLLRALSRSSTGSPFTLSSSSSSFSGSPSLPSGKFYAGLHLPRST